jgi:inner membrane protein
LESFSGLEFFCENTLHCKVIWGGGIAVSAGWIFASRALGLRALGTFSVLYVLIYMLLRLEDNALLVGAVASFVAVAAAMYFTRGIDWYSSLAPEKPADSAARTAK